MVVTWRPMTPERDRAYRSWGFLSNPFGRGPMTYRQPLIARSNDGRLNGVDWHRGDSYELQPIMQD